MGVLREIQAGGRGMGFLGREGKFSCGGAARALCHDSSVLQSDCINLIAVII